MKATMVEVPVELRTEKTKGTVRVGAAGMVPAVVYGRDLEENLSVKVEEKVFHTRRAALGLVHDPAQADRPRPGLQGFLPYGNAGRGEDRHLTGHVISADFHVVSATEKVHTRIPVVLRGESPGVKLGGVLEHLMHEVHVDSLVTDIPTEIVVDISDMDIGERFRVEDLPELSGVVFMDPAEEVIVLIASPRSPK